MGKIYSSIACNLESGILSAALPLFEQEKVQAIEWSFDTLFKFEEIPPWFSELIMAFSEQGRLVGHGVFFSLFSGRWSVEQQQWLDRLAELSSKFRFDHVTEHFGFMTGEDFHSGAPISVPFTASTLAIGRDRLSRIYQACQCPVGLENLAFSYSLDEVKRHGGFLEQLIEPINGFIILDLHNIYCQIHNFNVPMEQILGSYPLDKVREIHISGGSWVSSVDGNEGKIRRDTHDDAVPDAVFSLLKYAIRKCPNLKFVVLEQLGTALKTEMSQVQFRRDFNEMDLIVQEQNSGAAVQGSVNDFLPELPILQSLVPLEDQKLHDQQFQLYRILEIATGYNHAKALLSVSDLSDTEWEIENWAPHMLETALAIAQKWKGGFYKME